MLGKGTDVAEVPNYFLCAMINHVVQWGQLLHASRYRKLFCSRLCYAQMILIPQNYQHKVFSKVTDI